jgi:hypothetical protein
LFPSRRVTARETSTDVSCLRPPLHCVPSLQNVFGTVKIKSRDSQYQFVFATK